MKNKSIPLQKKERFFDKDLKETNSMKIKGKMRKNGYTSKQVKYIQPVDIQKETRDKSFKRVYSPIKYESDTGRSMVEMLGTLAVIGVLSVGGIVGYRYAMNKYRANQLANELNLTSSQIALTLLKPHYEDFDLSIGSPWDEGQMLSGDYPFTFGCGSDSTSDVMTCPLDEEAYYLRVENIPEDICRQIAQMTSYLKYLEEQQINGTIDTTGAACRAGNNTLVTFFETKSDDSGTDTDTPEVTPTPTPEPPVDCGSYGTYSWSLNKCQCYVGYTGINCTDSLKDVCEAGGNSWYEYGQLCVCTDYNTKGGIDCTQDVNEACNNHGSWVGCGIGCTCDSGWAGVYCEKDSSEISLCSGHGTWDPWGYCVCNSGYGGTDCSQTEIEVCSGNGTWQSFSYKQGYCQCNSGYGGADCSQTATAACSGNGTWKSFSYQQGYCQCNSGYGGADCSQTATETCSGNGTWQSFSYQKGYCECNSGYGGADCSQTATEACSNHGTWYRSYCSCDSGYGGKDCSKNLSDCQHVISVSSSSGCFCDSGWAGTNCDVPESEYCKNGFWESAAHKCVCPTGYTGEHCDETTH